MSMVHRIVILGATGSLGTQTLEILKNFPDCFRLTGISAHQHLKKLKKIAKEWRCEKYGMTHVENLIDSSTDHLMVLDHGLESLAAVLKALAMKKRVSIANKELMVVHGEEIVYLANECQAELIPLDSEHNAIFQCLRGEDPGSVQRLILTASGGPFRERKWEDLKNVTPEEVLKHPTWKMGAKTTVDSATLVNKAFEIIEAHHLFSVPYDRIEVRLHPESIVHAIVEFRDGTSKLIAYPPDMRFSLGYALFYPERAPSNLADSMTETVSWDKPLIFEKIEKGRFPCFDLVLETAKHQPHKLSNLLKQDQQAVENFLNNHIPFMTIFESLKIS